MEIIKQDESEFIYTDLHVHTPSSSDYNGDKTDEEYLEILRRFSEKNIKVIAITDHNTVKGYQKITLIKERLQNRLKFLEDYINDPELEKLKDDYSNAKEDIKLFDNMLILPGIEFEAKPGIHMILLFDPSMEIAKIERFIEDSGYSKEIQGVSNPDIISKLDVLDLLSIAEELGAYVIAPHVDSNKGIYQDTSGTYRAQIFRSNQLIAISYNNPTSRDKIIEMIQNKEYTRTEPLAYIQSSDYHGGEINGRKVFLKLASLTFEEVINALKNPTERVSLTRDPKVTHILNQIIKDPATLLFKDLSKVEEIQASASAILNMGYGYLVIGIDSYKKSIQGIKIGQDIFEFINNAFSMIKPVIKPEIKRFPFGDREVIVLLFRNVGGNIYYLSDANTNNAFIIKKNKVVVATPEDISKLVESRLFLRLEAYQKKQQDKIMELLKEVKYFGESVLQYKIISKIEKCSEFLSYIVKREIIPPSNYNLRSGWNGLGCPNGNIFIATQCDPRLSATKHEDDFEDSYLRFLCPSDTVDDIKSLNVHLFTGKAIIICQGGGTHIIQQNTEWGILALEDPVIIIQINENELLNYYSLLAWLKSSIFLWYSLTALGDMDIFKPEIFKRIKVPLFVDCPEINTIVDQIIEIETMFLIENGKSSTDSGNKLINQHNKKVNALVMQMDDIISKHLRLTEKEETLIRNYLIDKGIYCLSITNKQL